MSEAGWPFRIRGEVQVRSPRASFRVVFDDDGIRVVFDRLLDLMRAAWDGRRLKKALLPARSGGRPSQPAAPDRRPLQVAVMWKRRRLKRFSLAVPQPPPPIESS